MTEGESRNGRSGRIPFTLQAVFLASNRGKTVNRPPPEGVATKVFVRHWFFQRKASSKKSTRKVEKIEHKKSKDIDEVIESTEFLGQSEALECEQPVKEEQPKVTRVSPQAYLDQILKERGYSTETYKTLETAYYNKPTPLQIASYDVHIIEVVRKKDVAGLRRLLKSGLSPNPANAFGESLLHTVCRRGDWELLSVMLEYGCDVAVSDDYGRTPLHDAFWAAKPSFQTVELVLEKDIRLIHLADSRGSLPLSFVRKENWDDWIQFFNEKKDHYWVPRNIANEGEQRPPALTEKGPNTRPLRDPANALTVELATLVAQGKMDTDEALLLKYSTEDESESDYSDDDDDDDSSSCDDDDCSASSDFSFDEDDIADILSSFQTHAGHVNSSTVAVLSVSL